MELITTYDYSRAPLLLRTDDVHLLNRIIKRRALFCRSLRSFLCRFSLLLVRTRHTVVTHLVEVFTGLGHKFTSVIERSLLVVEGIW